MILLFIVIALAATLLSVVFGKDLLLKHTPEALALSAKPERLESDVRTLFGTPQPRSVLHMESLEIAAAHIKSEWQKLGLEVIEQKFSVEGVEYKNLIVSLGPKEGKRLVIGAHYDVCEEENTNARGADDNASGVAGLLELTRMLVESKVELKQRLDLVAYTLEEPPHFATQNMGSAIHAKSLKDAKAEVIGMISLEMIGYFSDAPNSQEYPIAQLKYFYPSVGNFVIVAGNIPSFSWNKKIKRAFQRFSKVEAHSISAPDFVRGIQFSDNLNYTALGYSAVMITDSAFYRNHNYHQVTDTPETLDYKRMAEVVNGVYGFLSHPL